MRYAFELHDNGSDVHGTGDGRYSVRRDGHGDFCCG